MNGFSVLGVDDVATAAAKAAEDRAALKRAIENTPIQRSGGEGVVQHVRPATTASATSSGKGKQIAFVAAATVLVVGVPIGGFIGLGYLIKYLADRR